MRPALSPLLGGHVEGVVGFGTLLVAEGTVPQGLAARAVGSYVPVALDIVTVAEAGGVGSAGSVVAAQLPSVGTRALEVALRASPADLCLADTETSGSTLAITAPVSGADLTTATNRANLLTTCTSITVITTAFVFTNAGSSASARSGRFPRADMLAVVSGVEQRTTALSGPVQTVTAQTVARAHIGCCWILGGPRAGQVARLTSGVILSVEALFGATFAICRTGELAGQTTIGCVKRRGGRCADASAGTARTMSAADFGNGYAERARVLALRTSVTYLDVLVPGGIELEAVAARMRGAIGCAVPEAIGGIVQALAAIVQAFAVAAAGVRSPSRAFLLAQGTSEPTLALACPRAVPVFVACSSTDTGARAHGTSRAFLCAVRTPNASFAPVASDTNPPALTPAHSIGQVAETLGATASGDAVDVGGHTTTAEMLLGREERQLCTVGDCSGDVVAIRHCDGQIISPPLEACAVEHILSGGSPIRHMGHDGAVDDRVDLADNSCHVGWRVELNGGPSLAKVVPVDCQIDTAQQVTAVCVGIRVLTATNDSHDGDVGIGDVISNLHLVGGGPQPKGQVEAFAGASNVQDVERVQQIDACRQARSVPLEHTGLPLDPGEVVPCQCNDVCPSIVAVRQRGGTVDLGNDLLAARDGSDNGDRWTADIEDWELDGVVGERRPHVSLVC